MLDFLIYAEPRSGSAWLSTLLSWGHTLCYHEPLAEGSLEDVCQRPRGPTKVVGAIDTHAYVFTGLKARKTFALTRDDSNESLGKIDLPQIHSRARFAAVTKDMRTFRYEELFDLEYLASLILAVGADVRQPTARMNQLLRMTITRNLDELAELVRATHLNGE